MAVRWIAPDAPSALPDLPTDEQRLAACIDQLTYLAGRMGRRRDGDEVEATVTWVQAQLQVLLPRLPSGRIPREPGASDFWRREGFRSYLDWLAAENEANQARVIDGLVKEGWFDHFDEVARDDRPGTGIKILAGGGA